MWRQVDSRHAGSVWRWTCQWAKQDRWVSRVERSAL